MQLLQFIRVILQSILLRQSKQGIVYLHMLHSSHMFYSVCGC